MAQTPLLPGTIVVIDWVDSGDTGSEGQVEAYLVTPRQYSPEETDLGESDWVNLGNSFGANTREHFVWLVKGMAAFHNLPIQNDTPIDS